MRRVYLKLTEEDVKDLDSGSSSTVIIKKGDTEYVLWNEYEVDTCPYCNEKPVDVDDFGLVCCNDCLDKHPEWKRKLHEQTMQERYDLGGPMNDND